MSKQSHFDKQLDKLIGAESEIESELDKLEDEDGEEEEHTSNLPEKVEYDKVPTHYQEQESDKFDDYQYARNILYGLIERGTRALEGSIMVAGESEHPRAYEVSSTLMKNVSEMTKELMALHDKFNEGQGKEDGQPTVQNNTQNNYYNNGPENKDDVNSVLDNLDDDEKGE